MDHVENSGADSEMERFIEDLWRQPSRTRLRDLPAGEVKPWTTEMLEQMGVTFAGNEGPGKPAVDSD